MRLTPIAHFPVLIKSELKYKLLSLIKSAMKRGKCMRTLKEVKIGETVRVLKVGGEGAIKRRIMDMGITKGVEIRVRKVAPLGDPVEITVRGYELTLRKADCANIEVE